MLLERPRKVGWIKMYVYIYMGLIIMASCPTRRVYVCILYVCEFLSLKNKILVFELLASKK
jgi:hypothetical protein